MGFWPCSEISIGKIKMRSINDGVIKRSIFTVGDTAVIKLPLSAYMRNTEGVLQRVQTSEKFKVGDPVTIRLGYDGKLRTEFVGFVRRLNLKMPLEIECEDWTYPLRTINIKKSWKKASIKEIIQFIAKEAGFKLLDGIPEWSITNFIANNVTALWVLNELKDKYGLTIYFTQDNKLYAGLAYVRNTGDVKMVIGRNIIKADDLKYMNADDVKLKIKAISMERNGSKIEAEIGDKDGEIRTLYFYDVRDKSHLEQLAKSEIGKYKYNGYRGVVNCFLRPYVEPSMTSVLSDPLFPERSGSYFVETTEVNFGVQGARRKVSLGIKLTK